MAKSSSFELLTDNRKERFSNLLKKSRQLDIASAFVTNSKNNNELWQEILQRAKEDKIKVRLVAGTDNAFTSPEILETDLPGVEVLGYITNRKEGDGIFHPKLYIFYTNSGKKEVFLGSANFTKGGFDENEEILLHLTDAKVVDQCQKYFNEVWSSDKVMKFGPEQLEMYKEQHSKLKQRRVQDKAISEEIALIKEKMDKSIVDSFTFTPSDGSFLEYCSLIYQVLEVSYPWLDEYIPSSSGLNKLLLLLDTLEECNSLIKRPSEQHDREEILKIKGTQSPYAFLGRVERSSLCAYANKKRLNVKESDSRDIMRCLKTFSEQNFGRGISKRFTGTREVLDELSSFYRMGITNTSRFMCLARPDLVLSYNDKSQDMLEDITGIKSNKNKEKQKDNYMRLLEFVWNQPWYKNKPESLNEVQERIWNNRAAMIDVLVYEVFWKLNDKKSQRIQAKIRQFFNCAP